MLKLIAAHRWSRAWICLFIVVVLCSGFLWAKAALHEHYCSSEIHVIPSNGGSYDAIVKEENCDAFGSVNSIEVNLRRRGIWGFETKVFLYEPIYDVRNNSDAPSVKWAGADKLEIYVNTVSQVHKKIFVSHGIHISYKIGKITYP